LHKRHFKSNKQITYILNITFFRRNTFFVITDLKGEIKLYLTCGQAGFKGKDKMAFMAITETTQKFLRLVWLAKMRRLIIKYKGYHIVRRAFKKGFKTIRKEHKFAVIAFIAIISRAFNGCKRNKRRRL
jgi:ribosomal protein S11